MRARCLHARLLHPSLTPLLDARLFRYLNLDLDLNSDIVSNRGSEAGPLASSFVIPVHQHIDSSARRNARAIQVASSIPGSFPATKVGDLRLAERTYSSQERGQSATETQRMALFSAVLRSTSDSLIELTLDAGWGASRTDGNFPQWQIDPPAPFASLRRLYVSGVALCTLTHAICVRAPALSRLSWSPSTNDDNGDAEEARRSTHGAQDSATASKTIVPLKEFSVQSLSSPGHLQFFQLVRPQPIQLSVRQWHIDYSKPVMELVRLLGEAIDASRLEKVVFKDLSNYLDQDEEAPALARDLRLAMMKEWRGSGVELTWKRYTSEGDDGEVVKTVV